MVDSPTGNPQLMGRMADAQFERPGEGLVTYQDAFPPFPRFEAWLRIADGVEPPKIPNRVAS
jgi:hypothetical protein